MVLAISSVALLFARWPPLSLLAACVQYRTQKKLSLYAHDDELDAIEDGMLTSSCPVTIWEHRRADLAFSTERGEFVVRAHSLFVPCKKKAPSLLLLHGDCGSALSFIELIQNLSEKYDIYLLDLPGFGRSHLIKGDSLDATTNSTCAISFNVNFVAAFVQHYKLGNFTLLGHSWGAFLAIHYGSRFPVERLILLSPAFLFPTLGPYGLYVSFLFKNSIFQFGRFFGTVCHFVVYSCILTGFLADIRSPRSKFYWYAVNSHVKGFGDRCVAALIDFTWTESWCNDPALAVLAKLNTPVVLIYGELDPIIPASQGRVLQGLFDVPIVILKGGDHTNMHGMLALELAEVVLSCKPRNPKQGNIVAEWVRLKPMPWQEMFKSTFSVASTERVVLELYRQLGALNHPQYEVVDTI